MFILNSFLLRYLTLFQQIHLALQPFSLLTLNSIHFFQFFNSKLQAFLLFFHIRSQKFHILSFFQLQIFKNLYYSLPRLSSISFFQRIVVLRHLKSVIISISQKHFETLRSHIDNSDCPRDYIAVAFSDSMTALKPDF